MNTNITLHFYPQNFESVFLINGVFLEKAINVTYTANTALYVTVLPLKAMYMPYTVQLVGGRVDTNKEIAASYILPQDNFYIKLFPRNNYIYAPESNKVKLVDTMGDMVKNFFLLVKAEKITEARKYLTAALNSSIDDKALLEFFSGFNDVIKNDFSGTANIESGEYFFINGNNEGILHTLDIADGLIDNIAEVSAKL